MALLDMMSELRGSVPKLPFSFTKTLINRAYGTIRNANLWSFQLFESSWISPPPCTTGTVTVTQGSATITFNAAAYAALLSSQTAYAYSPITIRQFRIGIGGIYNIISINFSTGVALLDRIYGDSPSGASQSYTVYQAYYAAPYSDFLTWKSVRNQSMFLDLGLEMTRAEVDARDPQRSWYQFPTEVVPLGVDMRGSGTANASATLGYPMFELWGQATTPFTYQCYGIRKGVDLSLPTDTLPFAIPEHLVLAKARRYAYEWAEANKEMSPRSQGPDFRFLMGATEDEYKKELTKYRRQDKELVDNWFSTRAASWGSKAFGYYNTIAGVAGPYGS